MTLRLLPFACASLLALTLSGCGDDAKTGKLSLAVTDAPVDGMTAVVVTFTGLELNPVNGQRVVVNYDTPRQIDLLALQGGLSASLLDDMDVPAGDYSWIRLKVGSSADSTESFVMLDDGTTHSLFIPSGAESGLKLIGGVSVAAGGISSFTIDFDLRNSIHDPQGGSFDYILRPTLRIVDNLTVGMLTGTVSPTLLPVGCTPVVYVYAGSSIVPDDIGGSGVQPITSTAVLTDPTTLVSTYSVGFLAAGTYTAAFTCQAALDAPAVNDAITFAPVANATIVADSTTTLNFNP